MLVLRIISRMSSSRSSIFDDTKQRDHFKQQLIMSFLSILRFCPRDKEFVDEMIEFMQRILQLIGGNYFITEFSKHENFN